MMSSSPEAPPVTIAALLADRKITGFQVGIVIICAAVMLVDGFDFQSISVAAVPIASQLGLDPNSFGPVFAIGLLGGLVGGVSAGPLSEKVGRKPILLVALVLMTVGSALTPLVEGFGPLLVWRVVVGLGLGAALPCVIATTSEYSNPRTRAATVALMFAGYPLGAFAAGLGANAIIPRLGWQGLFWINAVVPVVLFVLVLAVLPESVGISANHGRFDRVGRVLRRLRLADVLPNRLSPAPRPARSAFASVFQDGRATGTIVLSAIMALSLLATYCLSSWIPVIGTETGLPKGVANIAIALSSVGSLIGAIFIPRIRLKAGSWPVIAISYILGAFAIAAIGFAASSSLGLILTTLLTGIFATGAQLCVVGFIADYFDESVRATGVGIAVGFGRVGAIIGPILGGLLLESHVAVPTIFLIIAAFPVLCACGVLLLGLRGRRDRHTDVSAPVPAAA
jgi:AAHS family 4-hydroxybenzoate transporter-like MFS transporter